MVQFGSGQMMERKNSKEGDEPLETSHSIWFHKFMQAFTVCVETKFCNIPGVQHGMYHR